MRSNKRLIQKMMKKKIKRNKRSQKQRNPFGIQYSDREYLGSKKVDLREVDMRRSPYQEKEPNTSKTNEFLMQRYMSWMMNKKSKKISIGHSDTKVNECGFPWVDLGSIPVILKEHLETPTLNQKMTLRDLKLINDQTMFSPNGNQIPMFSWVINDQYFEGRDLDYEVSVKFKTLTNSTYFGLLEKDGFIEEIFNDPEEMKKYMCWVVRISFEDKEKIKEDPLNSRLFIDCPLDLYMEFFLKDFVPLKNVS